MAEAIFVLQAFTVQRGAAGGATQQEAAGTHVGGLPGDVAHALEAEHRLVPAAVQDEIAPASVMPSSRIWPSRASGLDSTEARSSGADSWACAG
ncbi:hypothetical protein G6F46_015173 [Rhizopus delemar]|nr:hypothetical protein G6F46_015173 [Rhizopus delemar]